MCDNEGYIGSIVDISEEKEEKKCDLRDENYAFEFEDALDIVGHGSYHRWQLAVLSVVLLAAGIDMFGFAVIVFSCSCDLQLTLGQKTILNSVPFAGPIVMSYIWGYFSDTRGRQKALVYGLGGGMIAALLSCFSPDWAWLAVLKLISVSLSSCAQSTTYTLLGESCVKRKRDLYMIVMTSFLFTCQILLYGLCYIILPLDFSYNMGFLGRFLPWRLLSLVLTLPLVLGFVGMLYLKESPKFLLNQGRQEEALQVLRDTWICNGGSPDMFRIRKITLNEEAATLHCKESLMKSLWHQTAPLFKPPLLKPTLQLFYIVFIAYSIANGYIAWFPFFIDQFFSSLSAGGNQRLCELLGNSTISATSGIDEVNEHCSDTLQDSTIIACVVFGVFTLIVSSSIILIPNRKKLVIIGMFLFTASSAIGTVCSSEPLVTISLFMAVATTTVIIGPLFSYFVDFYPTSHRGMAACLGVMAARFSSLAGTNIIGTSLVSHCEPTFYGACAFILSHGSYNITLWMVTCIIMFAMCWDMYAVTVMIIGSNCEFNLSMPQKSLLAAAPFIGPLVMSYPWGYISDTQGRRKSMLYALSLAWLCGMLSAFSSNWILLGVLRIFGTGFSSCVQSGGSTLLGESCVQRVRRLFMLLISSFMSCMVLGSNLLAFVILEADYAFDMGFLGYWSPWRTYAVTVATPLGVGALLLLFYNESPKFLLNVGREKEALDALRDIWTRNGGDPDKYPVKRLRLDEKKRSTKHVSVYMQSLSQVAPLFKPPLLYRTLQMFYLISVLYSTLGGFYVWFPFIVNSFYLTLKTSAGGDRGICDMLALATDQSPVSSANTTAAFIHSSCSNKMELKTAVASASQAVVYVIMTLCVYKFAMWRRIMMIVFLLLAALAVVGVILVTEPVTAMVMYLSSSMHALGMGIIMSYFVDLFPTSHRGMAACLGVVVARCSILVTSGIIGGYILEKCRITFLGFSVHLVCGAIVAWFLPSDKIQTVDVST